MSKFFILNLQGMSILEQLRIEEALLRANEDNWCLINQGTSDAIVMGISGKVEQLIDLKQQKERAIPIIKRFTGGGTVYVDTNTLFVTFIANEKCMGISAQPRVIMEWTKNLYQPFFMPHPFRLLENDYVMGEKKMGGNAQYVQKGRFLHHTSFLWDYDHEKMGILKMPPKRPQYRQDREHEDFLTKLSYFYEDQHIFTKRLFDHLRTSLQAEETSIEQVASLIVLPHRKATIVL